MRTRHVRVLDCELYVETYGEGPDLLWLNGGFGTTDGSRDVIDAFAEHFTVHAPDPRGHGRSTLGRGEVTYARMASDYAVLLDQLGLDRVHVFGHSDGGCVALHLLFDHAHLVDTAVLSGTPWARSSYTPEADQFCTEFPRGLAAGTPDPLGMWDKLVTDGMAPERIQALGAALVRAWSTTPHFTTQMLATIDRPTLVVEAGADPFIPLTAFQALTAAIPTARGLALPDMTHDPRPFARQLAHAARAALPEGA